MLQTNDFDLAVTAFVDFADNADQPLDIPGAVRNYQHIAGRIGRQVSLLRHQWPQDRHQLCCGDIIDLDNPRHHGVATARLFIAGIGNTVLLGADIRHDLDHFTAGDGGKTVYFQYRLEYFIDFIAVHRPRRHHRYFTFNARINDKITSGYFGNGANKGIDIGIFQIQRHGLRHQRRGHGQADCQ